MTVPVAAALSLSAAAVAYLNARFSVSYDLNIVQAWISSKRSVRRALNTDTISVFYTFEEHAKNPNTASRTFLKFEGKEWTYADAYETALKYGTWLKTKRVQKGDVVAMDFTNCEQFIWIWLGLWSIGAKPAFINYNLAEKALIHSIKASKARLLLVDGAVKANFTDTVIDQLRNESSAEQDAIPFELVFFDPQLEQRILNLEPIRLPNEERGGEQPHYAAMLIYTSGTTGMPKAAIMSWYKCRFGGNFLQRWIGFRADDVVYTCMPLYHSSAAVLGCCSAIAAGCTIALGRRFSRSTFWREVGASQATLIQYVGETCRYLLAAPPSPADKAHRVRVAYGNGLRPDVWRRFKERFSIDTIAEFYASTEGPLALWNLSTSNFTEGSIGYCGSLVHRLLGGKNRIVEVDPDTNLPRRDPKTGFCIRTAAGQPGEVIHQIDEKDVTLDFPGYFGNHKATDSKILRDVFRKGDAWFSSGDILRKDHENRWHFHDRAGDTYRWKSENVSTAEVSQVLGTLPGVVEANVYGVQLPNHDGRAGCAAITFESEVLPGAAIFSALAAHASAGLPRYAVPLFLRVTDKMQTTGTNKQQKQSLREQGVDPKKASQDGDRLYWLRSGAYRPFGDEDWSDLQQGRVKL